MLKLTREYAETPFCFTSTCYITYSNILCFPVQKICVIQCWQGRFLGVGKRTNCLTGHRGSSETRLAGMSPQGSHRVPGKDLASINPTLVKCKNIFPSMLCGPQFYQVWCQSNTSTMCWHPHTSWPHSKDGDCLPSPRTGAGVIIVRTKDVNLPATAVAAGRPPRCRGR